MSSATDDILARWYAALKAGDMATFREVATPDVMVRWNGPADLIPWAGEHHGVEAVLAFFGKVGAALAVLALEPVERLIADDKALLVLKGHWQVRATGQALHVRAANLFTFRDGRVAAYEVFADSAAFVRALEAA
ncbi:MAG: nuclear transport factor 2 family protein [Hyphomicrobiales bacterium]|jgi:ketosteroid isomerase-like protein|nr:nuclear transport factor 2 family protein [Hyphomicrobiales bacterium]